MNFNFTKTKAFAIILWMGATFTQQAAAQNTNIQFRSNIPYAELSNIWGYVDTTGKPHDNACINVKFG